MSFYSFTDRVCSPFSCLKMGQMQTIDTNQCGFTWHFKILWVMWVIISCFKCSVYKCIEGIWVFYFCFEMYFIYKVGKHDKVCNTKYISVYSISLSFKWQLINRSYISLSFSIIKFHEFLNTSPEDVVSLHLHVHWPWLVILSPFPPFFLSTSLLAHFLLPPTPPFSRILNLNFIEI